MKRINLTTILTKVILIIVIMIAMPISAVAASSTSEIDPALEEGANLQKIGQDQKALNIYTETFAELASVYKTDAKKYMPMMATLLRRIVNIHAKYNQNEAVEKDVKDMTYIYDALYMMDSELFSLPQANFYFNMGVMYSNMKNYSKSVSYYMKAIDRFKNITDSDSELDYSLAVANIYMARDAWHLHNADEATKAYDKALEICAKHEGYDEATLRYRDMEVKALACFAEMLDVYYKDVEQAESCLLTAVEISKKMFEAKETSDNAGTLCEMMFSRVRLLFNNNSEMKAVDLRAMIAPIKVLTERYSSNSKCQVIACNIAKIGINM